VAEVASIVWFSDQPERVIAFYRAVGVRFEEEDHGDGLLHAATDTGGVHLAIFAAERRGAGAGWRSSGSTFVGFNVGSLDSALASVRGIAGRVLVDHQVRPWGCRAVVEDPDGRAVEINQRGHCGEEVV
jgi:lactoylglutathione lyase